MELKDLTLRFSDTRENQQKAIFSSLFIAANRLQTLFDRDIPELSLKQFMLLSIVRQAEGPQPLTQLGGLLGCSRQNVKKLAQALVKKGFALLGQSPADPRALCLSPTEKAERYFREDFARYQQEMGALFEVYSPAEVGELFRLMMKLYGGIENLEKKTARKGDDPK